jgi:hypothetical protein
MFHRTGLASITLSAVVLDIPDRSGRYIAKDIAAGWAYFLVDSEGDSRFRGEGTCHGGRDMALRCAFLAAVNCVPDSSSIRIVVEGKETHRCMVGLAVNDTHVREAIDGRPLSVASRPDERTVWQARMAAERAAVTLLRDRERAETRLAAIRNAEQRTAELSALAGDPKYVETVIPLDEWRVSEEGLDQPWPAPPIVAGPPPGHWRSRAGKPSQKGFARFTSGIAGLWGGGSAAAPNFAADLAASPSE